MQRKVALAGIGLLAGFGIGWAVGNSTAKGHHLASPPATNAPDRSPAETVVLRVDDARRSLTAWYSLNCPWSGNENAQKQLKIWAEADPQAALVFVSRGTQHSDYDHFLAISLAWLCHESPAKANAWILANNKAEERAKLARSVLYEVAGIAPHAAIAFADTAGIELKGPYRTNVLAKLASTDPTEFYVRFSALSPTEQKYCSARIAYVWAADDLDHAILWCESLRGQPGEAVAIRGLLSQVAQQDPKNVFGVFDRFASAGRNMDRIAFCLTINENLPDMTLPAIAGDLLATDPARTVELFQAHQREYAGECIARAWTRWRSSDRIAADVWAGSVQDPEVKAMLASAQLGEAAKGDPAMFLSCLDSLPPTKIEKKAVRDALLRVSRPEARKWIVAHPDLAESESTSWLTQQYLEEDRGAAVAWVYSLPVGVNKDQALAQIALSGDEAPDIAVATSALEAITNPDLRTTVTFKLYTALHSLDKIAALLWLETQPITPEMRANWETLLIARPSLIFPPRRNN